MIRVIRGHLRPSDFALQTFRLRRPPALADVAQGDCPGQRPRPHPNQPLTIRWREAEVNRRSDFELRISAFGAPLSPVSVFFQALFVVPQTPPLLRPVLSVLTARLPGGAKSVVPSEAYAHAPPPIVWPDL